MLAVEFPHQRPFASADPEPAVWYSVNHVHVDATDGPAVKTGFTLAMSAKSIGKLLSVAVMALFMRWLTYEPARIIQFMA